MNKEFENWWPSIGQTIGKVAAELAWDEQQRKIDELNRKVWRLEAENEELYERLDQVYEY